MKKQYPPKKKEYPSKPKKGNLEFAGYTPKGKRIYLGFLQIYIEK